MTTAGHRKMLYNTVTLRPTFKLHWRHRKRNNIYIQIFVREGGRTGTELIGQPEGGRTGTELTWNRISDRKLSYR